MQGSSQDLQSNHLWLEVDQCELYRIGLQA